MRVWFAMDRIFGTVLEPQEGARPELVRVELDNGRRWYIDPMDLDPVEPVNR